MTPEYFVLYNAQGCALALGPLAEPLPTFRAFSDRLRIDHPGCPVEYRLRGGTHGSFRVHESGGGEVYYHFAPARLVATRPMLEDEVPNPGDEISIMTGRMGLV